MKSVLTRNNVVEEGDAFESVWLALSIYDFKLFKTSREEMFTKFALRLLKGLLRISLHRRPFKNYSHLSNKLGGWNKRGGWDFVEKTNA